MHWIDHDFLPDIYGTVERFIFNRHGEVDGLILIYDPDRFLFVHLPPHLGAEVTAAVAPGDAVRVRGIRPRGADMVAAVAVITSDGHLVLDTGPDDKAERSPRPPHEKGRRIEVESIVRMPLFGPKGELRGALLEDGMIVRLGVKEAAGVAGLLRPGTALAARGEGLAFHHGRVLCVAEIGPDLAHLRTIEGHAPESKPKKASRAPATQPAAGAT